MKNFSLSERADNKECQEWGLLETGLIPPALFFQSERIAPSNFNHLQYKNTTRDGGSIALYTVYTVYTVYTLYTVFTVYTIQTALHCSNISKYAYYCLYIL